MRNVLSKIVEAVGLDRGTGSGTTKSEASRDTKVDIPIVLPGEQRRSPRVPLSRPLVLVPVLPDGGPDFDRRVEATVVDVSAGGVGLVTTLDVAELPTSALVLLAPEADGTVKCVGVEARHSRRLEDSGQRWIGASVGGYAEELLHADNLTPRFCAHSIRYRWNLPEETLREWADVGVLLPLAPDRVMVCPKCQALPTFRHGCRNCGSAQTEPDVLVHHFACAHIGFLHDFETKSGLVCPKCRTRDLIVGADYEHQAGPYRCAACHWADADRALVAQCLGCGLRFTDTHAQVQELTGYRVNRLDLLAVAAPPRAAARVLDRPSAHGRPPLRP